MEMWSKEVFESLVGETITAHEVEGPSLCQLTVLEVVEPSAINEKITGFTVTFQCDEEVASQGCVRIEHPSHEPVVLFVSPKSKNEVEAVFNSIQ